MSGIGETFAAGQLDPPTRRADDQYFADVATLRCGQAEVGQQLKGPGANDISTRLVSRELSLVDQGHPCSASSEDEGGDASGWTAAYNDHVEAR
jgi:hypothetical protein